MGTCTCAKVIYLRKCHADEVGYDKTTKALLGPDGSGGEGAQCYTHTLPRSGVRCQHHATWPVLSSVWEVQESSPRRKINFQRPPTNGIHTVLLSLRDSLIMLTLGHGFIQQSLLLSSHNAWKHEREN